MKTLVVEPSKTYRLLLNEFLHGFSINPYEVADGASAKQIKEAKGFEQCIIIILSSEQCQEKLTKAKTDHVCQKMALVKLIPIRLT